MNNFEKVEVKWKDITTKRTLLGWLEQDEVDDFVMDNVENVVLQTGYLYEEDETQIILIDSHFENNELYGNITKIPKWAILSIVKLKY
jgi:hypothetical protein